MRFIDRLISWLRPKPELDMPNGWYEDDIGGDEGCQQIIGMYGRKRCQGHGCKHDAPKDGPLCRTCRKAQERERCRVFKASRKPAALKRERIVCKTCGEATPPSRLAGDECPDCRNRKADEQKAVAKALAEAAERRRSDSSLRWRYQ